MHFAIYDCIFAIYDSTFAIYDSTFAIYDSIFAIYDSILSIYDSSFTIYIYSFTTYDFSLECMKPTHADMKPLKQCIFAYLKVIKSSSKYIDPYYWYIGPFANIWKENVFYGTKKAIYRYIFTIFGTRTQLYKTRWQFMKWHCLYLEPTAQYMFSFYSI